MRVWIKGRPSQPGQIVIIVTFSVLLILQLYVKNIYLTFTWIFYALCICLFMFQSYISCFKEILSSLSHMFLAVFEVKCLLWTLWLLPWPELLICCFYDCLHDSQCHFLHFCYFYCFCLPLFCSKILAFIFFLICIPKVVPHRCWYP